jgi:Protein phosphatase 2C
MPADSDQRPLQDAGYWVGLTASQMGAAHKYSGLPNQDAVAVHQVGPDLLVAAVADGHGHHRHFRSARGSRFAVAAACQAAEDLAVRLEGFGTADEIRSEVWGQLVPAITGRWREAVHNDHAAEPFTPQEEAARAADDDVLVAYGSTLLLAIAGRKWLVLTQIGDGDIVCIRPDGRPLLPVPGDPSLDGHQTTSLCTVRAEDEFRVGVVHIATSALLGVLLATDGYGNAQADDPWADSVSADLAELISDRPPEWLAAQLPLWASRCASTDGSADDTTIALLIAPSVAAERPEAPTVPAARERGHQPPIAAARRMADRMTKLAGEAPTRRDKHLDKAAVAVHAEAPVIPAGTEAPTLRVRPGSPPAPAGTPAETPTVTVRTKSPTAPAQPAAPTQPTTPAQPTTPTQSIAPARLPAPPSRGAAHGKPPGAGAPSGGHHAPAPARRSRRPLVIAAVLVVIAAVVAVIIVTQLGSSPATPKAAPSITAHASPAAGAHPSAIASAGTSPAAASAPSATGQVSCSAQSSGTGVSVKGPSAEMCDPVTGLEVPISMTGLPAGGSRIALQVGGSIFVLDGDTLWWRPVDGQGSSWHDLGSAPDGPQQDLCSTQPGTVIAAASDAAQGTSTAWTQVTVPAESPSRVGKETQVPSDPCGAGPNR